MEESATLLAYLLSKLINEQSGIFHLLHEKLRAEWKENLKNLSEHALLLGTSEYVKSWVILKNPIVLVQTITQIKFKIRE